jgi:hypothetical protein
MVALNPPAPPVPNLAETLEFLSWLPSPAPNVDTEVICVLSDIKSAALQARSLAIPAIQEALHTIQGTHNCYFQVNAGPKNQKADKTEITHVRMLHVDLDNPDGLELLRTFPIVPSVTIFSGGGYQAFWFFKDAYAITRPSDIQAFEDLNQRIAQYLKADHCWNIDRVMRLPGTLNVPTQAKLKAGRVTALAYIVRDPALTDPTRFHDPRAFTELPPVATQSTSSSSTTNNDQAVVPLKLSNLAENLRDPIPQEIQELIEFGDAQAQFPSRSEAVWRVVLGLHRVDLAEHIQVALLLHKDNAISESILERADPLKEAWRQVRRGQDVVTKGWPEATKKGPIPRSYANAIVALRRLGVEGFVDAFREKYFIQEDNGPIEELSDLRAGQLREKIRRTFRFDPGKLPTREALEAICGDNVIHSIRDAFPRLKWDGKPRLKHLLWWYFGADKTELNEHISEIIMTALVRRVRFPGTKFDTILVLEGPQGSNKSTALAILAGKQNFSDQDLLTMDTKTQAESICGILIYELSELGGLHKADVDKVKAFASRDTDRVRPAFGHYRIDRGRQTIFIGTTNEDTYLRDTTGNRRFWPVKTTLIRLDDLIRDRLQLWAEAVHLEAQGRSIVLEERLWAAAAAIQHSRLVMDSWAIALQTLGCYLQNDTLRVSTQDVLAHLDLASPSQQNLGVFNRIRDAMRSLKWVHKTTIRINGVSVNGYEAPNDGTVPHTLIPGDPLGEDRVGRPNYLRVVDENFSVDGKPVDPKKIH